jgi:hypothetical protein
MGLLDRLRGRAAPTELDLSVLREALGRRVALVESRPVEPALVHARLADRYRDLEREPPEPGAFLALVAALDAASWQRLALVVSALDEPAVRGPFRDLRSRADDQVRAGFAGFAQGTSLLTLALLRQSPLRLEEFARRWAAALALPIRGEAATVSADRLERLDYGRLLGEADRARQDAEGRLEQLRQKAEAQDRRVMPRRGKW